MKTIQEATEVELKATLWEIEQQARPLQNQHNAIIDELRRRATQTKLGDKNMEEEVVQTEQPVEEVATETPEEEEVTDEVVEEVSEEPVVEDAPSE